MKKILLLCQHFYPEMISTGMHMTELACALTRLGWQVTVCCAQPSLLIGSSNPQVAKQMKYQGIKIVRVSSIGSHDGSLPGRFLFALTYLLASIVFVFRNFRKFDGLLITTNPPFLGIAGWFAKSFFSKPYVFIVYDVYPDLAVRLGYLKDSSPVVWCWEKVIRLILNGASAIVVIGRDMADIVGSKTSPANRKKIKLIPNWSDEKIVYPVPREKNAFRKEHCPEGSFVVQYSGRMGRTHNLEPLIEAAELLRNRPIIFQFIGDGAKRKTLMEMKNEKRLENVRFLPYQSLDRLNEVLSAADLAVVCLESAFTGLSVPSKAYGIMAGATPILGFLDSESEIGRAICENECGVVLSNPTGSHVAQVIEGLFKDPHRLKQMGPNGYNAFKANYTLTRAAEKYSALLEAALIK